MKPKSKTFLETGKVLFLPLDQIRPNPAQPRRDFDPLALRELADSVARYGVIQPVSIRRRDGGWELIAGERRLRAAWLAGLREIPCVVMAVGEEDAELLALVENLQRRDLDFIEEAQGIARLIERFGLSQEQAALRLGKSQSAVANKLRLLRLSPAVLEALRSAGLSERHARALLRLQDEAKRLNAISQIVRRGLNVAQTEALVQSLLTAPAPPRAGLRRFVMKDVRLFLNSLDHHLDTMKNAGIPADLHRTETEEEIVLTIRLPKRKTQN